MMTLFPTALRTPSRPAARDPMAAVLDQLPIRCQIEKGEPLQEREHYDLSADVPAIYLVREGRVIFASDKSRQFEVKAGELLIVLRHPKQGTSPEEIGTLPTFFSLAPGELWSGKLACAGGQLPPLLAALPDVLHVQHDETQNSLSTRLLAETLHELSNPGSGTPAIINSLLTTVVLQTVRRALQSLSPLEPSWIQGLQDAELGPIFALMLQHPERMWTIESLAAAGHLPRSTFARRFRQAVGEPPMNVLTVIRMQTASRLLQTSLGLKDVARRAGYRSLSAFCAVFQRWSGVSPQTFRKHGVGMHSVDASDSLAACGS